VKFKYCVLYPGGAPKHEMFWGSRREELSDRHPSRQSGIKKLQSFRILMNLRKMKIGPRFGYPGPPNLGGPDPPNPGGPDPPIRGSKPPLPGGPGPPQKKCKIYCVF